MISSGLTDEQIDRITKAIERVPFGKLVGLRLDEVEPGKATLSMEIRTELKQNHGVVHGGAIATLIDSATAFSIITLLKPDEHTTTVDLTINYLRPLTEGTARANARVVRAGGRIIVTAADVFDDAGNLAATALSTYIRLTRKKTPELKNS